MNVVSNSQSGGFAQPTKPEGVVEPALRRRASAFQISTPATNGTTYGMKNSVAHHARADEVASCSAPSASANGTMIETGSQIAANLNVTASDSQTAAVADEAGVVVQPDEAQRLLLARA